MELVKSKDIGLLNKSTITSLELLEQINFFRKEEGKQTELQHKDLLKIIRDEFDEEIQEGKISLMFYDVKIGNGATRQQPMYILTLSQARQVLSRESKYVRKAIFKYLDELENKFIEMQQKEIEHSHKVINGLIKETELKNLRSLLKDVINYKRSDYHDRWSLLYNEFESIKHINLKSELEKYKSLNKGKNSYSKLDYIEYDLKMLPQLYEIACKLFKSDVDEIIARYKNIL